MTIIPAGNSSSLPNAATAKGQLRIMDDQNEVQKDMFLKLMIAQLRNQDPTSPMDQKDMMASMTQFSQVEQMQNMTKAVETLSLSQGVNMVGQHVQYRFIQKNDAGYPVVDEVRTGKVISVEQSKGTVQLTLENGVKVKPEDVSSISHESRPAQTLMGKYVTYSYTGTNPSGAQQTITLTGKVNSVNSAGDKVVIGGRLVDPANVVTVSNLPLASGPGGYLENPPSGWT